MMMKIRMDVDGSTVTGALVESATSATEKISDLPRKLSTRGAPAGIDPDVGDITYYAPWGNLAIFIKDFGYSRGLVKLGRIETGLKALQRRGALAVRMELVE